MSECRVMEKLGTPERPIAEPLAWVRFVDKKAKKLDVWTRVKSSPWRSKSQSLSLIEA